ncbi:MAG: hypothetical protein P4M08_05425 [Oligoflexia bacterium]|nr:hypothetical protein [Oligoflexia bacterium]
MSYWKCLLIVVAVASAIFVRAATFAQRNLPVIDGSAQTSLVTSTDSAQDASSPEDNLNFKSHANPRPTSLSKVTTARHAWLTPVFHDFTQISLVSLQTPTSYIQPTLSRPPAR